MNAANAAPCSGAGWGGGVGMNAANASPCSGAVWWIVIAMNTAATSRVRRRERSGPVQCLVSLADLPADDRALQEERISVDELLRRLAGREDGHRALARVGPRAHELERSPRVELQRAGAVRRVVDRRGG